MKKIFSAEMYKVRHNLSFFVSMIASVPLGALFTIVMCLVPEVTMPDILSGVVSYYKIFFIVMIAMYVTNDPMKREPSKRLFQAESVKAESILDACLYQS